MALHSKRAPNFRAHPILSLHGTLHVGHIDPSLPEVGTLVVYNYVVEPHTMSLLQVFCFTVVGIAALLPVLVAVLVRVSIRRQSQIIDMSALGLVRQLRSPLVESTAIGEMEGLAFWSKHDAAIKQAWDEWALHQQLGLPPLDETIVMDPALYQSIHQAWNDSTVENEEVLKDLWKEMIPGVYSRQIFTPEGIQRIRQHLKAASESGIPTRRPNGMNRFGLVLDVETQGGVSYPRIDSFRDMFVDTYLRPLGRMFFQNYIGPGDDSSAYAFTIRYQPNKDVKLNEHSDASVVTLNMNLNLPEEDYDGSSIYFVDENGERHELTFLPGMALLHRGLHRHAALPIEFGERHNMVMWLFGDNGYVRFAPYEEKEQMSVTERWTKTDTPDLDKLEL
jgi:hypothetical protein